MNNHCSISAVLAAHYVATLIAGAVICVNGREYRLKGTKSLEANMATPHVVLLARDKAPDEGVPSATVITDFVAAAQNLIEKGIQFSTVLHPSQAVPAFHWHTFEEVKA
ncbi:MAG: hypothetical protein HZA80_01485 [Candidatus Taylorbacteria bacterium]|nr:hypothetical protein [Candidatus Taylorbacteria bacterium]